MEPLIPTLLSPTDAASALGIEVVDLALTCRERAAEKFSGIAQEIRNGFELDEDELASARRLLAAAEACDEVWEQDNPSDGEHLPENE